ncbi:UNVERIFIED_CONTAM: hypothetical protein FKN15_062122 [Acipenser sinensis]
MGKVWKQQMYPQYTYYYPQYLQAKLNAGHASWLPSGASSKGTPRGVQGAPCSLDVASSSPGYSTADLGWELPGGGAQFARGGEGVLGSPCTSDPRRVAGMKD